jgi:hypothetical protein
MRKCFLVFGLFLSLFISSGAGYYLSVGCTTSPWAGGNGSGVNDDLRRYITMGYTCGVGTQTCNAAMEWSLQIYNPSVHGWDSIAGGCHENNGNCGHNNTIAWILGSMIKHC